MADNAKAGRYLGGGSRAPTMPLNLLPDPIARRRGRALSASRRQACAFTPHGPAASPIRVALAAS